MHGRTWRPRSPYRMPSHSPSRMSSHNRSRMPRQIPDGMTEKILYKMPKPKLDRCKSTDRCGTCDMRGQRSGSTKILERSSGGNKMHGFNSGPHKMSERKIFEPKMFEHKISEPKMPEPKSRPCKMFAHLRSWKASGSATSVLASRHFASFRRDQRFVGYRGMKRTWAIGPIRAFMSYPSCSINAS